MARRRLSLAGIISLLFSSSALAQSGFCPPNMDFEMGDFTNWTCRAGTVSLSGGVNTVNWGTVGPPVFDRHTIITTGAGIDTYGGFPRLCPNGSGVSALLGNATASLSGGVGVEASGISYTYSIPAGISQFSIFFHYAVVLENPNHQPEAQPRFRARIRDLTTGNNIPCVDFDFTASSSLPGFQSSPINSSVLYKDWTPVTLNLTGLAGRTIELEFIVTECTQQGHFAYAYVDVNSNCNGAIQGSTICQGDNEITLTAPYGFQSYQWFSDPSFTAQLAATQSLYMNPAPSVGTTIPVIVVPYPGFGCRDTLYATITVSPKPPSNAGADQVICKNAQVQLGGPPTMGYQYEWTTTPAGQISNTTIANPTVSITGPGPERFIVRTTDILTGCFSRDTAYVSRFTVDTALTRTGPLDFCDQQSPTTLSLAPGLSAIQWYDASGPLTGANGQS